MIATESYPPLDYGARPAPRRVYSKSPKQDLSPSRKLRVLLSNGEITPLSRWIACGTVNAYISTVQDGALAFLVVVSSGAREQPQNAEKAKNAKRSFDRRLDMAEVAGSNPAEPTYFRGALVDRRLE